MLKSYIVMPTYNEQGNVKTVLQGIFELGLDDLYVLVVDDNSPDGTGALVTELKKRYPRLDILHRRQKEGLGKAYVAGFYEVLKRGADYIFEMDADLSHDPSYLSVFLESIKEYDLVLGSRYVPGGGIRNWNMVRKLISYVGNVYARLVLRLPFYDLTGGFKCYRRQVLEKIDLSQIDSLGYNFQIETTYKAFRAGFRIKEIPIIFTERVSGKSKFNFRIMFEGFWRVLLLRLRS